MDSRKHDVESEDVFELLPYTEEEFQEEQIDIEESDDFDKWLLWIACG